MTAPAFRASAIRALPLRPAKTCVSSFGDPRPGLALPAFVVPAVAISFQPFPFVERCLDSTRTALAASPLLHRPATVESLRRRTPPTERSPRSRTGTGTKGGRHVRSHLDQVVDVDDPRSI